MRAEDVREAQSIVEELARLKVCLTYTVDRVGGWGEVHVIPPGFDPSRHSRVKLSLTAECARASLDNMRRSWTARVAHLRRRAAQIGLKLED